MISKPIPLHLVADCRLLKRGLQRALKEVLVSTDTVMGTAETPSVEASARLVEKLEAYSEECTNPQITEIGCAEIWDLLRETGSERPGPVERYVSGVEEDSYNSIPAHFRSGLITDDNSVVLWERPLSPTGSDYCSVLI